MGVWRDLSVLAGSVQGGDAHPQPIALSAGTCTWSFGDTHRENVQFLTGRVLGWSRGGDAPISELWRSLVAEVMALEKLRLCLGRKEHLFGEKKMKMSVLFKKSIKKSMKKVLISYFE